MTNERELWAGGEMPKAEGHALIELRISLTVPECGGFHSFGWGTEFGLDDDDILWKIQANGSDGADWSQSNAHFGDRRIERFCSHAIAVKYEATPARLEYTEELRAIYLARQEEQLKRVARKLLKADHADRVRELVDKGFKGYTLTLDAESLYDFSNTVIGPYQQLLGKMDDIALDIWRHRNQSKKFQAMIAGG